MASKNTDFDHMCHVIMYRLFFVFVHVIVMYE